MKRVKVVVTRPNHDYATFCGYSALDRVNEYYFLKGYDVVDLPEEQAVRENVLRELPTSMFYGVGHGSERVFTGWKNTTIFYYCDCKELSGSIVYLLSCLTGKDLGYDIVEKKARSYLGYTVEFTWVVDDYYICKWSPYEDRYCKWFFNPVRVLLEKIADGLTVGEANEYSIAKWNEGIRYWTENPENDPYASFVLYYLIWDRDGQVLYGDPHARLKPVEGISAKAVSTYDVNATIYDMVLQPEVSSTYGVTSTYEVRRRRTFFLYAPAITAGVYGVLQEDPEKSRKALLASIALGAGAFLYQYITRPRYKPYVPPGVVLQSSASSTYEVSATAQPPIELKAVVESTYAERTAITRAIPVEPYVTSSYDDTATVGTAIPVEASEVLDSILSGSISVERVLLATESFTSGTSAQVLLMRTVSASASSTYVVTTTIVRMVSIRPSASSTYGVTGTIGVAMVVSATESFSSSTTATVRKVLTEVRPQTSSIHTATSTIEVQKGLSASAASVYTATVVIGSTLSISATESFASSTTATV